MKKSIQALAAVAILGALTPARAAEVLLVTHNPSSTKVYAEVKDGRLHLKSIGPTYMVVNYNIDANANGVVDPEIDVAYGFHDNGMLCAQKWLTEASWSHCGKFASAARSSQEVIGDLKIRRLDMPVQEVARNGRTFAFKIDFWDSRSKARSAGSGLFTLATGLVSPAPTGQAQASPAIARPPQQSGQPAGNYAPLGREFQVTATMTHVQEGYFRQHKYDLRLRGTKGDRFRLAWRSPVPVNLDYGGDAYEADYPDNATIFDLSSSVTITLNRSGDQVLTFSQSGLAFPKSKPSGSLAGPSLEGKTNRAFLPFTMIVQKLN